MRKSILLRVCVVIVLGLLTACGGAVEPQPV